MHDVIIIALSTILVLIGIIGSIIPILPGPPVAYCGLLLVHFTSSQPFSIEFLIIFGILAILSAFVDNVLPIYATKMFDGSKKGVWGSAIGLIIGIFFFPPLGIIIGPMLGAYTGEVLNGKTAEKAIKPAFGSLFGFLSSIFLRLSLSIIMAYYFVMEVFIK